jgi:Asp-tRNAAsn/Glu-tRNAGln amidotransferase A subunit and related amidases
MVSGELSSREVVEAHLERIAAVNPAVNAIVTLVEERAMTAAHEADQALALGEPVGRLHGLPIAHKDLALTAGIRTTFGSPIFSDFLPNEDELFVQRLHAAGAILVGKTNTPEFGAGSQTFNEVFGATHNPYDLGCSAGGSSGGAAAALASGMLPIADGSDLGGSLRNPASFCNVVGFRPSPGRVPSWPSRDSRQTLSVEGPMGRTVGDAALLLAAMTGPDPRVPVSLPESGEMFAPPLGMFGGSLDGPIVAWAPDGGGTMPVDARVRDIISASRATFESLGCHTEDAFPDLHEAREVFFTLRAHRFAADLGPLLQAHRDRMKATVVWNIEEGLRLSSADIAEAEWRWTLLTERVAAFFTRFDFIVMPVAQVPPFDISLEYPGEVAGVPMTTYLDWMESCWCITVTGHPAISVPCGFSDDGLPVGVQIVGRRADDLGVLRLAHAFERSTHVWRHRPQAIA